ncbi:unnamed protein product, partial [Choristocarpus tenellus]
PFIKFSVVKEVDKTTNTAHYDYVAMRILKMDVTIDIATVVTTIGFLEPVEGYLLMSRDQMDGRTWLTNRTSEILQRGKEDVPGGFVDVEEVRETARVLRTYFKIMQFHPILLRLSWARTHVDD